MNVFEHMAVTAGWPPTQWSILILCLIGPAQQAVDTLPLQDLPDCQKVRAKQNKGAKKGSHHLLLPASVERQILPQELPLELLAIFNKPKPKGLTGWCFKCG